MTTTTVLQLLSDALYLSDVSALEFDTNDDTKNSVALRWLNRVISRASTDGIMIPYRTKLDFTATAGQPQYPFDGLIRVDTLTFFLQPNNVRFEMVPDTTFQFWGTNRVNDIKSLPYHYYVQRRVGGSDILLYFIPDQNYQMEIYGKFQLTNVSINDTLEMDDFYNEYLLFKTAQLLCMQYNIEFNPNAEKELMIIQNSISELTGVDLTVKKAPLTQRKGAPYQWGFINYGRGWVPG